MMVVMMMVVVMMVVTYLNHDLRLRRIRCREAEDKGQCEQILLHTQSMVRSVIFCRATLTCARKYHRKYPSAKQRSAP